MKIMHPVQHTNRLIHETSPYLLQHAHNPVDWYAWEPEAFEAARSQNKPIFLSIGYSTCYWCHVMERESFENEQIAREMNKRFISIKVDREERPDVDQLYMTAVQVLTRQGGWPLSVFLAPDLRAFYGGTYFPPVDSAGRPGFLTIMRAIDDAYQHRLADVESTCAQLTDLLQQLAEPQPPDSPLTIDRPFIAELVERSTADFDAANGGFGPAPKFPRQTLLEMLLVYLRETPDDDSEPRIKNQKSRISAMLQGTLDAMADGGIRDHLGGGFHRYATDPRWMIPHFEIMLYDNAMLAWVYTEAFRQTDELRYARVARGILDFVLREMTSPDGAFYTAFDAEVDAQEGAYYLWTASQIEQVLGPDNARLFNRVYGLERGPNFADPHHGTGRPEKSVLYLPEPLEKAAAGLGMSAEELDAKLAPLRRKLFEARRLRKAPALDTKVLTGWNALMVRALAYAGQVLDEQRYVQAAAKASDHLLQAHLSPQGTLWHSSRQGQAKIGAFLDDYAFLIQALLELNNLTGQEYRKQQAAALATQMEERFGDAEGNGFFFTAEDQRDLIVRQKVVADSPLPSGNAVAAMALLDLEDNELAHDTIAAFARHLEGTPDSVSALIEAAILYLRNNEPIAVSPGPWRGEAQEPPSPQQVAAGVVSLDATWISPTELHVRVGILDTFHLNAHQTASGLVGTQLAVSGESAADVIHIDYPPGEERSFAFAEQPLRIYSGAVTLAVRFQRDMTARPPLRMALSYQACNENACFPPVSKVFEVNTP